MKNTIKSAAFSVFRYGMGIIDQNPELRQKIIMVLRKSGALAKVKKIYFNRLSEDENPFSHLMIGPVIAVDISANQLSEQGQKIFAELNMKSLSSVPLKNSKANK
jgi:hypothetical protein